jgi:AbrB family looped-hinge helix DNA binding protein
MTIHIISNKGWVVIPAEMRKKYGLKPGAEVRIVDYGGVLAIIPVLEDTINQAAGMLKTEKSLTRVLLDEHASEE